MSLLTLPYGEDRDDTSLLSILGRSPGFPTYSLPVKCCVVSGAANWDAFSWAASVHHQVCPMFKVLLLYWTVPEGSFVSLVRELDCPTQLQTKTVIRKASNHLVFGISFHLCIQYLQWNTSCFVVAHWVVVVLGQTWSPICQCLTQQWHKKQFGILESVVSFKTKMLRHPCHALFCVKLKPF